MAIETHAVSLLTHDDVRLDGDITVPADPVATALVCHPHPLYGGNRFNGVVESVVRALAGAGVVALRFDFRGVGASEGTHGDGIAERHDVLAALEHLTSPAGPFEGLPAWAVGYSFGAATVLAVTDDRLAGWVAVAPPLRMARTDALAAPDPRPKHVLLAADDQFAPLASTLPLIEGWANATTTVLPAADHFLAGQLDDVGRFAADAVTGAAAR